MVEQKKIEQGIDSYALKNLVEKGKGMTVGDEEQKRVEEVFLLELQFKCSKIVVEDYWSLEADLEGVWNMDIAPKINGRRKDN